MKISKRNILYKIWALNTWRKNLAYPIHIYHYQLNLCTLFWSVPNFLYRFILAPIISIAIIFGSMYLTGAVINEVGTFLYLLFIPSVIFAAVVIVFVIITAQFFLYDQMEIDRKFESLNLFKKWRATKDEICVNLEITE